MKVSDNTFYELSIHHALLEMVLLTEHRHGLFRRSSAYDDLSYSCIPTDP